jgi:hypothetical protein
MLGRILPKSIDNTYRGHWLGAWILALVAIVKLGQGLQTVVHTQHVALGPDGIPIGTYSPAAAQQVLALLALLGMYVTIVPLQCLLVLLRYRALVPLMYLFLVAVQLGARTVATLRPDGQAGPAPYGSFINLGILAATMIGFAMSVTERKEKL